MQVAKKLPERNFCPLRYTLCSLPDRFLCLHGFFSGAAAIEEQQAAGLLVQVTLAGKEHSNGILSALVPRVYLIELLLDSLIGLLGIGQCDLDDFAGFVNGDRHSDFSSLSYII